MFRRRNHIIFILAIFGFISFQKFNSNTDSINKPLEYKFITATNTAQSPYESNEAVIKPHNILILKVQSSITVLSEEFKLTVFKKYCDIKLKDYEKPYPQFYNTLLNYRGPPYFC